ncbi:MAG TPA: 5-formyltetrahydrofolate cyclo-ligase [Victivallales bacterium]|nr:5-formyltetrahydrofolate cyclo-ligase [Victivallales bacterium]
MTDDKKTLRKRFLKMRRELPEAFVQSASGRISERLSSSDVVRFADGICAFYPIQGEPMILPFLERLLWDGKKIFIPKYLPDLANYGMITVENFADSLQKGRFDIPEPIGGDNLDDVVLKRPLWIIPGAAFSPDGKRIGFGWGTFDILLKRGHGIKIGVCYERQIVDKILAEPHDVPMDYVFTEENIYKCNKNNENKKTGRCL